MFDDIEMSGGEGLDTPAERLSGGQTERPAATPSAMPQPTDQPSSAAPQPEPWRAPPRSWKAEMHQHYGSLPPQVMEYIHAREKQALDGIMHYKGMADPYATVNSKYQKVFDQYGVKPHEVYERAIQSHLALTLADPDTKRQYALQLIRDYGLDQVLGLNQQPGFQQAQQFQPLYERLQALEQRHQQAQEQELTTQVEKFVNDPKNEFIADVADDMRQLLESGAAESLEAAYETAIWQNPTVRQKLIEREIQKTALPSKPGPQNVRPSTVPPAPVSAASGSIDEDMAEIYDKLHR